MNTELSRLRILSILVLLILLVSLVFPTVAFADDGPSVPEPTEEPVTNEPPLVEDTSVTESLEVTDEALTDIVEAIEESDAVLVDLNGEPIPLVTEEAAEMLLDPDPYIVRGGVTYAFTAADCDPLIDDVQPCATPIQAAINFSNAGEVINIDPGTYVEQLFITKDVTLQATAGGVIIQAPNDIANCFTTSQQNQAIVCVTNTNNASIVGLTVDGKDSGNNDYRYTGIGFFNAGGTIQGNTVQHITDTPFSGSQHGNAIYAFNQDGTARTINVFDNNVFDYQKNGITMNGNGLTAIVDGNSVTGAGPTAVIAQNGIQLGYGATGEITNNEVSGHDYTGPGWSSAGVLLYDTSGTVLIEGNHIHDNQDGVSLADSVADITGNTIENNDWGVAVVSYSAGSSNANITLNEILNNDVGIYTDNSDTLISHNSIVGNNTGVEYDTYYEMEGAVDARGNWWGDASGPNEYSEGTDGCGIPLENPDGQGNPVSQCVLYDNWLTSNPFVQPVVVNTSGDSSAFDRIVPPAVIPVTGGQEVVIACDQPSVTYIVDGIEVTFTGLCGYSVTLDPVAEANLPDAVGEGNTFVAGISIALMRDGKAVETLPLGASLRVSYARPAGADADLMIWNGSSWDEIKYTETETTVSGELPGPTAVVMVTH